MDAEGEQRMEMELVDFGNGHRVIENASTPIPEFGDVAEYFEKTFDFHCDATSTSWTFRVAFARTESGDIDCVSDLRRTDEANRLVDVQLSAAIPLSDVAIGFCSIQYRVDRIEPGGEHGETFEKVILSEHVNGLNIPDMDVRLDLAVFDCHGEQNVRGLM